MGNNIDKLAKPPSFPGPEYGGSATTQRSPKTLSESEAWNLAMLGHSQLHGYVTLTNDHHPVKKPAGITLFHKSCIDFSFIERLEWIEFDFASADLCVCQDLIRVAQATTITWFALSCCLGFGANENPVFWKRVFSAYMQQPSAPIPINDGNISDCNQLLDHPNCPFPRIRFHGFSNSLPLEIWSEVPSRRQRQAQEQILQDVLRMLKPFIVTTRWNRVVPVSIRVEHDDINLVQLAQRFLYYESSKNRDCPEFRLDHVVDQHTNDKSDLVSDSNIRVCASSKTTWTTNQIHWAMERLLVQQQRSFDLDEASIQSVDLLWAQTGRRAKSDMMFAAWCSTLPHIKRVSSVRSVEKSLLGRLDDAKAAWLGYAIFHPDTEIHGSSVECLTLKVSEDHLSAVRWFASMAKQNGLLGALGHLSAPSAYTTARVLAGTMVFSTNKLRTKPLYTFPSECWITLCKKSIFQRYHDDWACIVLPGYGIGWVWAEDIVELQPRQPAPSCICRLRLVLDDNSEDGVVSDTMKSVVDVVLSALGTSLRYLDVASKNSLDTDTTKSVFRLCPNLESLRILHAEHKPHKFMRTRRG